MLFKGFFINGELTGLGHQIHDGNDIYGEIVKGKFDGVAEDDFKNGDTYIG